MIGFRNALVHDYVDIDRKIVYKVLMKNLEDFESFRYKFAQWL